MKITEKFTQRLVASIMNGVIALVAEDDTLAEAAAKMGEYGVSSVLVMRGAEVAGILTEHDLVRQLAHGIDPQQPVAGLMSRHVVSIAATTEIHEAFQSMLAHGIHHLLVMDGQGKPAGILCEADFRKIEGVAGLLGMSTVSSLMSADFASVQMEASLEHASRGIVATGARFAVVVKDGRPAGIVTEKDLVRVIGAGTQDLRVADIMQPCAVTVRESATSAEAAHLLRLHDLRILPVTGSGGELVGVFTEHDLVRQFEDDYIRMLRTLVAAQAKELNENKFHTVVNQLPQRIFIKDTASVFVACNRNFAHDIGVEPEDVPGKTDMDFFPRELAERYRNDDRRVMTEQREITVEEPHIAPDGKKTWLRTSKAPVIDNDGNVKGVVGIYSDITSQKRLLEELERQNWALRAISLSDKAIVYARCEQDMLQGVCQAITSESRYLVAWIGWAMHDDDHSVEVLSCAGKAASYVDGLVVRWSEGPYGNGPAGTSIRTGKTQIANCVVSLSSFSPWMERAARHGIQSMASIPLNIDGATVGTLSIYSADVDAFGEEETKLFEELADSIAYGIQARRTQAAYEKSLKDVALQANKLERALEDSLAGIAALLEQRDPYTAGHQQHVADLAVKIGRQMGLDEERLRSLYLGGIVHDIGKIQVPSEILSKPARLNGPELAMIRQHPEAGYNVLKKIDFPWPIAEIIRQHHEYLDGSGYPRRLRGEEILLEARILTVADIVESMSSDRPYRPALGIPEAIREITRMSGTKLDPAVVDACTTVLQRGEFTPHFLQLE